MSSYGVICIRSCPIKDSIYDIKVALEVGAICRVRKIFAAKWPEECNDEPTKKVVYIWVEWSNTNASCMFTARLNHHGEEALFKLDGWEQPIVTERDKYGNPTCHAHWVVRPSSGERCAEDELYFGSRENDKKWEKYLASGESVYDKEEVEEKVEEKFENKNEVFTLQPVLTMPVLQHNSPVVTVTPKHKQQVLSLFMPVEEEETDASSQVEEDAFIRENFNLKSESVLGEKIEQKQFYTKNELKNLARGEYEVCHDFLYEKVDKITFPNGNTIELKK